MNRSKLLCILVEFVIVSVIATTGAATAAPITLKFASFVGPNLQISTSDVCFLRELEKRSQGRVKFETYWDGALLKADNTAEGLKSGLVDVALVPPGYTPTSFPLQTITELIYVAKSPTLAAVAVKELYKTFEPFRKEWENQGLMALYYAPSTPNIIEMRAGYLVRKMEDLKGKRLRAYGTVGAALQSLGATPVSIPAGEIFDALSKGVVDGIGGESFQHATARGQHKYAPAFTDPGMGVLGVLVGAINRKSFDKLPKDIQQLLLKICDDIPQLYGELLAGIEMEGLKKALKDGCTFYILPPDEQARWKSKVVPQLWDNWIEAWEKKGLPAREQFERYRKIVQKFEPSDKYVHPFTKVEEVKKELGLK